MARLTTIELHENAAAISVIIDVGKQINCLDDLSEFGKRSDDFRALGAQVYGISVDSTWAHDAWRKQLADVLLGAA